MQRLYVHILKKISKPPSLKKGLSILEVVIAILMVGISVTTLLGLQGILSRGVFTAHAFVDRIGYMTSFLTEADRDKAFEEEKAIKKVLETPKVTMTYKVSKPMGKGLKTMKKLIVESIEAQWPTVFGERREAIGVLRFVPGKKDEKGV